jgi:hypothetical protein
VGRAELCYALGLFILILDLNSQLTDDTIITFICNDNNTSSPPSPSSQPPQQQSKKLDLSSWIDITPYNVLFNGRMCVNPTTTVESVLILFKKMGLRYVFATHNG